MDVVQCYFQREMYYIHLALMLRCHCPSVCLSVTEVHWRIIARFQIPIPIYRALRSRCMRAGAREGIIAGKSGGIISRYASHCQAFLLCIDVGYWCHGAARMLRLCCVRFNKGSNFTLFMWCVALRCGDARTRNTENSTNLLLKIRSPKLLNRFSPRCNGIRAAFNACIYKTMLHFISERQSKE